MCNDLPDTVVVCVGDKQVAVAVHCDSRGQVQFGVGRRAAVASVTVCPVSRHGANDAVDSDLSKAGMRGVRKIHVAEGVYGHAVREQEKGICSRAAIAGILSSTACDCVDDGIGPDLPDPVKISVRKEKISVGVNGHAVRLSQHRIGRSTAVARI